MAGEMRFSLPKIRSNAEYAAEVRRILDRESQEYQEQVADYIHSHLLRREDSTGRLEEVTRSEGNRVVNQTHWRVGIPSYLNRSQAKYWRLIEQGSAGLYAGGRGFRGTPLKLRPGGFEGGRPFRSFSKSQQRSINNGPVNLRRGTFMDDQTVLVFVKREIQPMNAYRKVFYDGQWRQRIQRDFEQSVGKYFLR